ncbi:GCN5 family acetyltransferase [Shewanella mangrovi]|uniref:GCN5 family acetyltransferase n=1 Tax=Shewanella mangrovi TaxID=1515746 RepID=A0A094JF04_9GAMM|nr:GNAT family N-acetyltransferase [Shewanella mangrovi]KFZ36624.1 GCN5 family acetyltransferase [Shewanella mangrovi]
MDFQVTEKVPLAAEYCQLRHAAGLSPKSLAAAEIGLANTLYGICVRDGEQLIGMGRVIGDGGCFFQIVDIAVAPSYQRQGLGRLIMNRLENYLQRVALDGSYVSLLADKPEFYEKQGYRPTAPASYGMFKKFSR